MGKYCHIFIDLDNPGIIFTMVLKIDTRWRTLVASFYFSFSNGHFEMYKEEVLFHYMKSELNHRIPEHPWQIATDRDWI